jgi:hypothetical protein
MPRSEKDFKRLIRERMRSTGETYTTARSRLEERGEVQRAESETLPTIDELLEIANKLPTSIERIHATTTHWRSIATARSAAGRVVTADDQRRAAERWPTPEESRAEVWMEFETNPLGWPTRWRVDRNSASGTTTIVSTPPTRWQDGIHREYTTTGGRSSPEAMWICSPFSAAPAVAWSIEARLVAAGREAVLLRGTPEVPWSRETPGWHLLGVGDEHQLTVDRETGVVLRHRSLFESQLITDRRVTEIEFPVQFSEALFAAPSWRRSVQVASTIEYLNFARMSEEMTFLLLVPTYLPAGLAPLNGSVITHEDGSQRALLRYQWGPELLTIDERPTRLDRQPFAGWTSIERLGRTVMVPALHGDEEPHRARMRVGGTSVSLAWPGRLPSQELIEVLFSVRPL